MAIVASNNVFPHDPEDNWKEKLDRGGYTGTAQDLKNQIDQYVFPDDIVVKGTVSKTVDNFVSIAALAFVCRIDQIEFSNTEAYSTTILPAADGFRRIDILVFTKFSTIIKIQGEPGVESAQEPDTPEGTIKIAFFNVFGAMVSDPEVPPSVSFETRIALLESNKVDKVQGKSLVDDEQIEKLLLLNPDAVTDSIVNVLYHQTVATNTGTVSSVGTNWTGLGTSINENMIGGKIVVDGSGFAIIATVNQGAQTFTTDKALSSDVTNSSFEIHYKAVEVAENGEIKKYRALDGIEITRVQYNGDVYINGLRADANGNVQVEGYVLNIGGSNNASLNSEGEFKNKLSANIPYFINDLPTPENNRPAYATVKDALNPVYGEPPVAGGTVNCSVFYNGSVWVVVGGKFGLRNIANNIISFFTNSNTASRTYTLQDRNGILADLNDIAGINTNKMNVPTGGEVDFLPKFLTPTTQGKSRIKDDGTYLGIDTVYTPIKDISLGNQRNKEIGIEDSDSIIEGRDLTVSAGSTVNFPISTALIKAGYSNRYYNAFYKNGTNMLAAVPSSGVMNKTTYNGDFESYAVGVVGDPRAVCKAPNGDVYASVQSTGIYKQTGGVGAFVLVSSLLNINSLYVAPNGDVYGAVGSGNLGGGSGDIYKQTGGVGTFNPLGLITANWRVGGTPNGDIYASIVGGDIYKQTGGVGAFNPLGQISRQWYGFGEHTNGDIYACVFNGDIYKQTGGVGAFNPLGQQPRNYHAICVTTNGYLNVGVTNGDYYYLNLNSLGTADLKGGTLRFKSGTAKGLGQSRLSFYTGQKTVSGTDMQVETKRIEVDELGAFLLLTDHTYSDAAAAAAAGLRPGSLYWNSSGDLKRLMP